jgi:hypothetical protein
LLQTKIDYYYYFKKKTHPTVEIAPSSPSYPKKEIALFKKEKKPQILFPLPKAPFITYIALFFQLIFITHPLYPFNPHILKQTPLERGRTQIPNLSLPLSLHFQL